MKYRFPFDALLRHRKFLEENLQREIGLLSRVLADEKKKLESLQQARKAASEKLRHRQKGKGITVSEVLLYTRFIERMSGQVNLQKTSVKKIEKNVEEKREDLVRAMKDRKIIEKLKEKKRQIFREQMMKQEQNFLNDMAAVRFDVQGKCRGPEASEQ
ncbi:MAG: flagellar export protein FliJ [Desulfococcus sp. 4484_242]|nr:MAG: flagellar export protein FliJ [Desulfococcus sp. 4484_242]